MYGNNGLTIIDFVFFFVVFQLKFKIETWNLYRFYNVSRTSIELLMKRKVQIQNNFKNGKIRQIPKRKSVKILNVVYANDQFFFVLFSTTILHISI